MGTQYDAILTVNAGSSSVKVVIFSGKLERILEASVQNIGQTNARLILQQAPDKTHSQTIRAVNQEMAVGAILDSISSHLSLPPVAAIGHRIVHGGSSYDASVIITDRVVDHLREISFFDPEHMQASLKLIEIFHHHFPQTTQVACFDTAFYRNLPKLARLLPLPRRFESLGLRRYGFHGLSYESLLWSFREVAGEAATRGRVILAHLGSGASLTALKEGRPLDTTMSFTPASGIPMSTRSGDLDPGIVDFLHRQTGMTVAEFSHMVHFESGLLGVSELSADMELLVRESDHDIRAADAVNLFCYQVQKTIGSFAAVLGGVDSLIFAGGIGENSFIIREKICNGLRHLGIHLDAQRNQGHAFLISSDDSSIGVHVIHSNEALVIATETKQTIYNKRRG